MRGDEKLLLFFIIYNFISTIILLFIIEILRNKLGKERELLDDYHNELVKQHKK